jgi:O-glycosyl hydrolase
MRAVLEIRGETLRSATLPVCDMSLPARLLTRTVWVLTLGALHMLLAHTQVQAQGQPPLVRVSVASDCGQVIDGFGTTAPPKLSGERWLEELYYGDLGASLLRVDLTPRFRPEVAAAAYNSPWFHGQPALPGPDGNNVRSYRDGVDYSRTWSGRRAPIVVLGPDAEQNLTKLDLDDPQLAQVGALARAGARRAQKKDAPFKLLGSVWSPAPWLKVSSGGRFEGAGEVMPKSGTPWPFIWAGNFAGGKLDTSGTPRDELDDGSGPTSALTQYTRITAATLLGFQRRYGVRFSAISLQNELNFETFYNSCTYPDAAQYVTTLKALRRELDSHPELRTIAIMGPEDLIDADAYALWQYGAGADAVHKNLQYLAAVARDAEASAALSFFAVHAYARDGVHGSGSDATMWRWWSDGWSSAPAAGLPPRVLGTRAYGKKSWMTESSGEPSVWASPPGEPMANSALGLALKVHQALTVGAQSAWLYWQLLDGKPVHGETLTDASLRERAPKYVAYKHYARLVRPDSCLLETVLESADSQAMSGVYVSAFRHPRHGTTLVLLNTRPEAQRVSVLGLAPGSAVTAYSSRAGALWKKRALVPSAPVRRPSLQLVLAAESLLTLHAQAARK